jgi:(2Fe-2S) ferredoxin
LNPLESTTNPPLRKIYICKNGDCANSDLALEIYELLQEWIAAQYLDEFDVQRRVKCLLTVLTIQPDRVTYWQVTPDNLKLICEQHLLQDRVVTALLASGSKPAEQ